MLLEYSIWTAFGYNKIENILNLGNIGDKVKVKNGYGRNFLLKKGKALRFNKENLDYVS